MVTSLFSVGQSVLMRAREGQTAARHHRTTRRGWVILSVKVSQVQYRPDRGSGEFLSENKPEIRKHQTSTAVLLTSHQCKQSRPTLHIEVEENSL